jgi:DNA invertase Pin-like site-specific DNA recombinase
MDAIIYIRWSSTEQTKGSSLSRQRKLCMDHCERKGWNVIREIRDDGISAWTGKNAIEGNLASFVDEAANGGFPDGIILVAEQLDRLSRRPVIEMFNWLRTTADQGVTIATVIGDGMIQAGKFDMNTIIRIAVEADVAHRQSEDKSTKLFASWADKRRKQSLGELEVITRRAPAWLKVEGKPAKFVIIDERVAIVRRIFEETVAGFGKAIIAKRLNQEKVPTFGRASGWHSSYIQKILNATTVLGEMQPGMKSQGTARKLVGDPIQGYYPAIIDADLFARARRSMAGRSRRVAGRGRRLVNMFSGIARCGGCGEKMTFRGKGEKIRADGSKVNEDYLVCDSYQRGRGCKSKLHFNYLVWETAVLNAVLSRAMGDERFASREEVRALEVEHAELARRREGAGIKKKRSEALFYETGLPEIKESWLGFVKEEKDCKEALEVLQKRITMARGAVTPEEHQKRIADLFEEMDNVDMDARFEARSRVMEAIHELVGTIIFNSDPQSVEIKGKDDIGCDIIWTGGQGVKARFTYKGDPGFFTFREY